MKKIIAFLVLSSLTFFSTSRDQFILEDKEISDDEPYIVENSFAGQPFDLWERIRKGLTFEIPEGIEEIEIYRNRLNQTAVNRISKSGQRYLYHTVKRSEELGIPVELALLPFVESEFDPYAQSVYGATGIARSLGISERIISVSIVSFGTSIPEFSASIIAALKKEKDLSIGNLIGSNIFNVFFAGEIS